MDNDQTDNREEDLNAGGSMELDQSPIDLARRRVVSAGAAVPIVLAVSGRSAMACTNVANQPAGKCWSLKAWCSMYPKGKYGGGTCLSHAPSGQYSQGCHPNDWTPNPQTGQTCFKRKWPVSVRPFAKCKGNVDSTYYDPCSYDDTKWSRYNSMCDPSHDTSTVGWKAGDKLPWNTSKSCSQVLMSANSTKLERYLCAAYLNTLTGEYCLNTTQLNHLATTGSLDGIQFAKDSDICDFLEHTFLPCQVTTPYKTYNC